MRNSTNTPTGASTHRTATSRNRRAAISTLGASSDRRLSISQQLTITLSDELADRIRLKAATESYASDIDLIEGRMEELVAEDSELATWMRTNGVERYDAYDKNPTEVACINTEGLRRLQAMKDDPSQCLTHEEFWSAVEATKHRFPSGMTHRNELVPKKQKEAVRLS